MADAKWFAQQTVVILGGAASSEFRDERCSSAVPCGADLQGRGHRRDRAGGGRRLPSPLPAGSALLHSVLLRFIGFRGGPAQLAAWTTEIPVLRTDDRPQGRGSAAPSLRSPDCERLR